MFQFPDPKDMQLNLTGFLHGKNARLFMQDLWDLLVSAQGNASGIPTVFLEKKKEELRQKKVHFTEYDQYLYRVASFVSYRKMTRGFKPL